MLSHHPAKFGGQWHCGSKDMIFLVVKVQDSHALISIPHYCLSLKYMECNALTHKISGYKHNNKLVCPMKDFRSWLHMSTRATDGSYFKTFHQSVQKRRREGKRKKKNQNDNCRAFYVTHKRKNHQNGNFKAFCVAHKRSQVSFSL